MKHSKSARDPQMRLTDPARRTLAPTSGRSRGFAPLLAPGPVYYLLMLAAFVAVFALIPLTLYLHSGEDWRFHVVLLVELAAIGLAIYVIIAVLVRLLAAAHAAAAAPVALVLFCIGVFALAAHVYAPVPVGPLDGSELDSAEPLAYTLAETVIAGALLVVLLQLVRRRGLPAAGCFAGLVIVVTFGYFTAAALEGRPPEMGSKLSSGSEHAQGNVYHFVLDTFQTQAFLAVLARRPELAEKFQGFELFRNNISNYITTRHSAASYFTSTLYEGEPFKKWLWSWRQRGLLKQVFQAGYSISMYAPFSNWGNKLVTYYQDQYHVYEEQFGFAGTAFYDFLHMWLVSLVPNGLTNEALEATGTVRDRLFRGMVGTNIPLSISDGVQPYGSVLMLRRVLREEAGRAPAGHYLYTHALLPHGPFVMDRECRYLGKPEHGRRDRADVARAYLDQAECSLRLLESFFNRLVELGRYDPATIVVHADTGHGLGLAPARSDGSTLGIANEKLLSSVDALLMIKRPHARGELSIREVPSQLVDLLPTLLDVLDLESPDYPLRGRSLYALGDAGRREALFGLDPDEKHGPNIIEVRIEDPSDLQNSKLTVLGPATDPDTWRTADKE